MDSSTNGHVKGGPTTKSVNCRPISTRNGKTASPSQPTKIATDNPRPASAKTAGPPSKSASAKAVTSGAKEATNAKNSLVRQATASPNKPRSLTQKDPASPVKPPTSQISRQQTKDKPSLLALSKAEAGKKSVEGAQPGKPKTEVGNSTPTKQNGAAKKDVGRVTQHGIVPKDKTPCLQPEISGSGPTKPLASLSSPTKPVKAPLTLNKPAKSVPAPDKPVNILPLQAKAAKTKLSSPKLTNTASPTTKTVKTASPLVKTPRLTSVPTKASTPPTSAVNATSSPAKPGRTPLVKPVNVTSTTNQVKMTKPTGVMTKQLSGLNKPTNRTTVASKSATVTGKPANEKRPVPKPAKTGESKQLINSQNPDSSKTNVGDIEVVNAQAAHLDTCSSTVDKSKATQNTAKSAEGLLDSAQSTLEPCNVSTELSAEVSPADSEIQVLRSLDQYDKSSKDLNNLLKKDVDSKCNAKSPRDENMGKPAEQSNTTPEVNELSYETLKPSQEPMEPVNLVIQPPLSSLQKILSPLEVTGRPLETTSSLEKEQLPVEPIRDELSSTFECSKLLRDQGELLEEKLETHVEVLKQKPIPSSKDVETPMNLVEDCVKCPFDSDRMSTPEELSQKEVQSPYELTEPLHTRHLHSSETAIGKELPNPVELAHHPKEEEEHQDKTTPHMQDESFKEEEEYEVKTTLNVQDESFKEEEHQGKTTSHVQGESFKEKEEHPQKPLEEEVYSPVEHAEPSEEVQTSSLEQVTPLEEGVELSEDEVGYIDEPNIRERGNTSLRHSEGSITFPTDFCNPLEIQATSSMEEVTPSDEEMELSKAEDETLQEKKGSEEPDEEDGKCSTDLDMATEQVMEAVKNLQDETETEEHGELTVPLHGGSTKPLDLQAEPANNVKNYIEGVSCVMGNIIFPESSSSPEMLAEPVTYLEGIEDSQQLTKGQVISESPKEYKELLKSKDQEENVLFKSSEAINVVDQSPIRESVDYESENSCDLEEHLEQDDNKANWDSEHLIGELLTESIKDEEETNGKSTDFKVFEEQPNIDLTRPPFNEEKQFASAEFEADDSCFPINLEQPGLSSVLFPEEPLTSLKQSEMALLETMSYLVEAPKTSFEPVKRASHAEEDMAPSICELTASAGDLVTDPVTTTRHGADIIASQLTEFPESIETDIVHCLSTTDTLLSHTSNVLELAELNTMTEARKELKTPEDNADLSMQKPFDTAPVDPLGEVASFQNFSEQPVNLIAMPLEEQKQSIDLITMPMVEQIEPLNCITMPVVEQKEPMDLISMPMEEGSEANDLITVPVEEEREPIDRLTMPVDKENELIGRLTMPVEEEREPIDTITMPIEENMEPIDRLTTPVEEEREPTDIMTLPAEEEKDLIDRITMPMEDREPIDIMTMPAEEELIDEVTMPLLLEKQPIDFITMPMVTPMEKCYPLDQTEEPLADLVEDKEVTIQVEPFSHTEESEQLKFTSSAEIEALGVLHPTEAAYSFSTNNTEIDNSPTDIITPSRTPLLLPADDHVQHKTVTADYLSEQTVNPAEAAGVSAETMTFSEEGIKGPIQALSRENQCEVNNPDLFICPTLTIDSWEPCQTSEKEQWVLVDKEELADFNGETEDKPQRPACLNQEGDNQEEPKVEEEAGERASVCSTLSDPQLAGKSSSETSTPEELRTYEDSSSGVESHSDDVATSPQTTLTPDPDLGIHMGQEEGSDTPAGTPASKSLGAPHPLQNASLEELSEGPSLSGVIKTSEDMDIAHHMEVTGFTCPQVSSVSREQRYEESTEEGGPLRGNDD